MDASCVHACGRWRSNGADVNSIAFIKAPIEDFPGSIATTAVDYAKIFENKRTKASIRKSR